MPAKSTTDMEELIGGFKLNVQCYPEFPSNGLAVMAYREKAGLLPGTVLNVAGKWLNHKIPLSVDEAKQYSALLQGDAVYVTLPPSELYRFLREDGTRGFVDFSADRLLAAKEELLAMAVQQRATMARVSVGWWGSIKAKLRGACRR